MTAVLVGKKVSLAVTLRHRPFSDKKMVAVSAVVQGYFTYQKTHAPRNLP
jgi:hypothetical protein